MNRLKQFLAWLFGYFWLPCPRCGRMTAGWECQIENGTVPIDGHTYVTCGRCKP